MKDQDSGKLSREHAARARTTSFTPQVTMQEAFDPISQSVMAQWVAGALAGGAGLVLTFQKMWKGWVSDKRDRTIDEAQTQIVEGLRTELARLHEQNGRLALAVNELQLEMTELRAHNAQLTVQIARLSSKTEVGNG